jgi:hypothetical protein
VPAFVHATWDDGFAQKLPAAHAAATLLDAAQYCPLEHASAADMPANGQIEPAVHAASTLLPAGQ